MKVSNQIKNIKRGFETSNHSFFTQIAEAVAKRIEEDTGLKLVLQGKTAAGAKIDATLMGQSSDPEKNGDIEDRVRQTMQDLKNPTALTDLLR